MRKIEPAQLLGELGLFKLTDGCWLDDLQGFAKLVRKSVYRRGAATRREVWHDWRVPLEAAGYEPSKIKTAILAVCEQLESIGDLIPVEIGRERGWIKAEPRWIKLNEEHAVLIGAIPPSTEKEVATNAAQSRNDTVRRFTLNDVDPQKLEDFEPLSLRDWLGDPEWNQYLRESSPENGVSLIEFWEIQKTRLFESSLTADNENATTFVCSGKGKYFGSFRTEQPSGRWQAVGDASDGLFVGARKGFNDSDWRYFLCETQDQRIRSVVGLESYNELSWTLMAKGISSGSAEVWNVEDQHVSFTFPPPKQLARLCDLLGVRTDAWKWRLSGHFQTSDLTFWT